MSIDDFREDIQGRMLGTVGRDAGNILIEVIIGTGDDVDISTVERLSDGFEETVSRIFRISMPEVQKLGLESDRIRLGGGDIEWTATYGRFERRVFSDKLSEVQSAAVDQFADIAETQRVEGEDIPMVDVAVACI